LQPLARAVRCAAFAATAALLIATQTKPQFFKPAFVGADAGDAAQPWARLVDCSAQVMPHQPCSGIVHAHAPG
jgi:hypothetical protein